MALISICEAFMRRNEMDPCLKHVVVKALGLPVKNVLRTVVTQHKLRKLPWGNFMNPSYSLDLAPRVHRPFLAL
uniref:Uncharacterized protein n=1 Tax=Anopheles stephensi TaxID=30069 RepID=A0A182YNL6_ANOST